MAQKAPTESLECKPMTPADFPAVYKFIKEHFMESEPLHSYLFQIHAPDFRYLERCANILVSIQEGTSSMFVTPSGEIAAIALSSDASNSKPNPPKTWNPIYVKVKDVILLATKESNKLLDLKENDKEMCFRILGTHPSWRKKGLGKRLIEKTIASAKENGYTWIRTYCTGAISAKLMEECGFECIYKISYDSYVDDNGEVVFKLPPPHTHLKVMVLKL